MANKSSSCAKLNRTSYSKSSLTFNDIINDGTLELEMSAEPNKAWGSGERDAPVTEIK
ncbi:MAG: hypothetical protein KA149_11775 [Chitinophagales bacterium]|nr:hypothetical protein [Chitinophagales bacterium]